MQNLFSRLKQIPSDALLKHTAIIFSGMMVVHICNVFFQMAVSRALSPREYALLASFLAAMAIIQRPLGTLNIGVSRFVSLLYRDNRPGDVKRVLRKWVILAGAPAILLGAAVVFFNDILTKALHLERAEPVLIAGLILPAFFLLPILNGATNGIQKFGWSASAAICGALARLVLGAGFVWFLYPACGWAMLGHGLGAYITTVMLIIGLFIILRNFKISKLPLPSMRLYLFQSFFIQAAFAILMTADVVLVKHFLPEDTEFAYAATLGRIAVMLPGAIVAAMFPKVASRRTFSAAQKTILMQALAYTALCVAFVIAACFLVPGLLARVMFGITEASDSLKQMIFFMAVVMGVSALLNVVIQFLLAQMRFKPAIIVVICALCYLAGARIFHAVSLQIVLIAGIFNTVALVTTLYFALNLKLSPAD